MRIWLFVHRYLGLFIGLQLLFWTVSGLFFSFSPIQQVRGEHTIRKSEARDLREFVWLPLEQMPLWNAADTSVLDVRRRILLDRPVYELAVTRAGVRSTELWDAASGSRVSPITSAMAEQIALADFHETTTVRRTERIEQAGPHSEYRGRELPAYRVELEHTSGTVIYVSAARGAVVTRRNTHWRWFDFFWMLHTMDYQGRDNFNHWPLQLASVLGVSTVVSGFGLWVTRTRWFRRRRRRSV